MVLTVLKLFCDIEGEGYRILQKVFTACLQRAMQNEVSSSSMQLLDAYFNCLNDTAMALYERSVHFLS